METPSLVLLDLNLPDCHGAETFRRIMRKAPNVPIVILSGQDDEALAMKAVHNGVQDYLVKSDITSKHLERALRYAVERQALLRALEITRQQQIEFKNRFLSHVSHELRTIVGLTSRVHSWTGPECNLVTSLVSIQPFTQRIEKPPGHRAA